MAFQNDRQMFDVNEVCGECNAAITQLPFQPDGTKPLLCRDCLRKRRDARGGGGFGGGSRPPRQMYQVNLSCAQCGTAITQLPFQPTEDRPVYCFDCNKSRRAA